MTFARSPPPIQARRPPWTATFPTSACCVRRSSTSTGCRDNSRRGGGLLGARLRALSRRATLGPRMRTRARRGARMLRGASTLYMNALNWPDARVGWLPYAWGAGRRLLGGWRPDLVYASSPPPTCLVVGKLLAAHCGVPWIAEFRDRWSDDPYYPKPSWRQAVEARLERRIVGSAQAIVTVSQPWAERYAGAYGKPSSRGAQRIRSRGLRRAREQRCGRFAISRNRVYRRDLPGPARPDAYCSRRSP